MESDVVHDGTRTGGKIHAGDPAENFRLVYARVAQCNDARGTGSDRCDNKSPSPKHYAMRKEGTGVTGSKSPARDIVLPFNAVSSMAPERRAFVSRTGLVIRRDKLRELSA